MSDNIHWERVSYSTTTNGKPDRTYWKVTEGDDIAYYVGDTAEDFHKMAVRHPHHAQTLMSIVQQVEEEKEQARLEEQRRADVFERFHMVSPHIL